MPGLVRILKAYLALTGAEMVRNGQVASVLAVVQQQLIPSRVINTWGFKLLERRPERVCVSSGLPRLSDLVHDDA